MVKCKKQNRRMIAITCVAALLIVAAVVVALRERQSVPLPEVRLELLHGMA